MQPFGQYMAGRQAPGAPAGGGFANFMAGRQPAGVEGMGGQQMPPQMGAPGADRAPPAPANVAPPTVSQRFSDFVAARQRARTGAGQGGAPAIAQAAQQRAGTVLRGAQASAPALATNPARPMPGAMGVAGRPVGLER